VIEVLRRFGDRLDPALASRAREMLRRGIEFSLKHEEAYAFIANHLAHHAYVYLLAHEMLDDHRCYQRAEEALHRIEVHTDPEGWHQEYTGADPGYQTRTLAYLVRCLDRLEPAPRRRCEALCHRSAAFLDRLILPDGTLYAMFGSRNTAIVHPSGIEYMALHWPERFAGLAFRVRESIRTGRAILPMHLEFDNFVRLFDDFIDAQRCYEQNRILSPTEDGPAPFHLDGAGLTMTRTDNVRVYCHHKYGGAVAVYRQDALLCKDAGLLFERADGRCFGARNVLSPSTLQRRDERTTTVCTELFESLHRELTPLRLVVLRLLNLTVLRVGWFADRFRTLIVRSMITGRPRRGHGTVTRRVTVDAASLRIEDECRLAFVPRRVGRRTELNLFHMASSRYNHPADRRLRWQVAEAFPPRRDFRLTRTVRFGAGGSADAPQAVEEQPGHDG